MKAKNILLLVGLVLLIYFIHMSGYLFAYLSQDKTAENYGSFSLLSAKGDLGFTLDLTYYTTRIKDYFYNGYSLFIKDAFIYENLGKEFPAGGLVSVLASLPLYYTDNLHVIFFVIPLIFLGISVLALRRCLVEQEGVETYNQNFHIFVLGACLVLLTSSGYTFNIPNFIQYLAGHPFLPRNLGYIGRFPNIQISIALLLVWFWLLKRFLRKKDIKTALVLALSLGVLQYSYFYFWSGALLVTALTLILRAKNITVFLKESLPLLIFYLILTLPFWTKFFQFYGTDIAQECAMRIGKTISRDIIINPWIILTSLMLLTIDYFYCKKEIGDYSSFTRRWIDASSIQIALSISIIFLFNIQVFIGYTVLPYHWHETFYYPLLMTLSMGYFIKIKKINKFYKLEKFDRIFGKLIILFAATIIICAAGTNHMFGKKWSPYLMLTKNEKQVVDFVKNKTAYDSVVMSNSINLLSSLQAQTHIKSYIPVGDFTYSPDKEIVHRTVIGFNVMGYDLKETKEEFKKSLKLLTDYKPAVRQMTYKDLPPHSATIPDNYYFLRYITTLKYYDRFAYKFTFPKSLEKDIELFHRLALQPYKLDYYVIYKKILPPTHTGSFIGELVFKNSDFEIYQFVRY